MIESQFTTLLGVGAREELKNKVVAFARHLGFDTVSATYVIDHLVGETEFITVDNTPPGYLKLFLSRENWSRDPVMQHCKRHGTPIVWDQSTYTAKGLGDIWELQACHGYRYGIALALHMPGGRHFFIGVDRDKPLPEDASEVTRLASELALFAVFAQDPAARVLAPPRVVSDTCRLTPREIDALRWTMKGKTAWEVGVLMAISEETAAKHLKAATRKLNCVNKLQAVLEALRLEIIS
ncbi:MAG: autoinducer binding domain-containing protein [Caldimonas sp.]